MLAIAAIAALSYALYGAAVAALGARFEIDHTYRVLAAITSVQSQLARAESAHRGYLVSGNDALLREFEAAAQALRRASSDLASLAEAAGEHVRGARTVQADADAQIGALRDLIGAVTAEPDRAPGLFESARAHAASIYALTREMQEEEARALEERQQAEVRQFGRTLALLAVIAALAVLILIPFYVACLRQIRTRAHVNAELRESKEAADAANHAKSRFLAVMSHEIRTPLSAMLGMLELLQLRELRAAERNMVDVVRRSAQSLHRLIDDILDFSKIEAGKLEIAPVPTSVRELIAEIAEIYSASASSKGVVLEHSIDSQLSAAHLVDPLRLRQIVSNLVSNAVKFTERGTVSIRAALANRSGTTETLSITVSDTGCGLAQQAQQRLFAPFAQGSAHVARTFGGSGLGLAISRELAMLMGGTLELRSGERSGTTATLTIPLSVADAPAVEATRATPVAAPRSAPSIEDAERDGTLLLVVDDHPVNRMVLTHQLNALGYAALTASDGLGAIEQWREHRFGAVLTDLNMPGMDGFELANRIREEERVKRASRVPIVACTANALEREKDACIGAGMDDYLRKPLQLRDLHEVLQSWVPLTRAATGSQADASELSPSRVGVTSLERLSREVGDSQRSILEEFHRATARDLAALEDAVRRSDLAEAARRAHRIKGASRMLGLTPLARACEALERDAREGRADGLSHLASVVAGELARVPRAVPEPQAIGVTRDAA